MPLVPRFLERFLLRRNLLPGLMLDFLGAQGFWTFAAAWRLGVFDALARCPLAIVEIARETGADARGTGQLLRALEAMGYVKQRNGLFEPTPMTVRWLPILEEGIPFFEMILDRFRDVAGTLRRGKPPIDPREWLDRRPNGWRDFQGGMVALARMAVGEIAAKIPLPSGARTLIDVGGGHGLYSVELCRRHPGLSATVFDLPQTLPSALEIIAREGMRERIAARPGDFWEDDLGVGHDVALLFNLLHANIATKNVDLLRKVASALVPGGLVVILDQVADARDRGGIAAAAAALNGLAIFDLAGGQTYAYGEIAGWLRAAGFQTSRRKDLRTLPGSALILGTKAGSGR